MTVGLKNRLEKSHAEHGHAEGYRGDIDGIRALAVLSVVLYHFGLPLRGGFTGVDVFFVISGFLIGGILWRELEDTGSIRLGNFFLRRIRRLAPAYFVMLAATGTVASLLLLPFEYREFGKAAIASTVYASNILFFRQSGYFDPGSEQNPLLHTWSLAVEEQFYLFLPIFLILLVRWRPDRIAVPLIGLVTVWALSLAACIWFTPTIPVASFYLFPFRAWELLTGVLLAVAFYVFGWQGKGHRALAWLGLGLLLLSFLAVPAGPLFPGVLAILPVAGTALLLSSGAGAGTVNRLLTHRVARFFGLISYSLYLWHWPVISLMTYLRGDMGLFERLMWMVLSVGLAALSWRYVEQPIRRARRLPGWALLGGAALASVAALGAGATVYLKDGMMDRFGPEAQVHIKATADFNQDWSRCYVAEKLPLDGIEVCPIGPDGDPRVLVWGDSHVRAFKEGIDRAAHEAGVPGLILWHAGCPPLFDVRKVESAATPAENTRCTQENLQIKQSFGRLRSIETVLLVGRWSYYAAGEGVGLDAHNLLSLHPTNRPERETEPQAEVYARAVGATVTHLSMFFPNIYVLQQPPELPDYDSRIAAREAAHSGIPVAAAHGVVPEVQQAALEARAAMGMAPWDVEAARGRIREIATWPMFCTSGVCSAVHDGVGQYFDNNHVTNSAALRVREIFAPVFASVGAPGAGSGGAVSQ
jgi:peptidoglycan/LPS O-acetylase OafA/YrhL